MLFVRSLTRATPSSPRSVRISVAPNSPATFCRDAWRLIAIILLGFTFAASARTSNPVPYLHSGRMAVTRISNRIFGPPRAATPRQVQTGAVVWHVVAESLGHG